MTELRMASLFCFSSVKLQKPIPRVEAKASFSVAAQHLRYCALGDTDLASDIGLRHAAADEVLYEFISVLFHTRNY